MKQAAVLFVVVFVAGCLSPASREPDRYFILEAVTGSGAALLSTTHVRVAPMSVSDFYDTQDIVYSPEPGTRAYYQFSRWTERPQRAIRAQLASRFEAGDPDGGLVLRTHLEEIYHDAAEPPGTARIAITAQLVDPGSGTVLARRRFSRTAPAASYGAPGAVRGFSQALGALLDDVVAWVNAEAPPKAR